MSDLKTVIYVNVEHFDGQADDDVGYPYYVAHSPELHFTTDGSTFEELIANVQECFHLCLEDGDSIAEFGVMPDAQVTITEI